MPPAEDCSQKAVRSKTVTTTIAAANSAMAGNAFQDAKRQEVLAAGEASNRRANRSRNEACARDGRVLTGLIAEQTPDLVLLDWMLPYMSGLELCRQLRRQPATANLPIIMLTARVEERDRLRPVPTPHPADRPSLTRRPRRADG